uniref:Uncharacterized protein n=1 Tax=Glossina pallidipes TaxID=7398 RepID=A0A1B0A9U6_GLOPL
MEWMIEPPPNRISANDMQQMALDIFGFYLGRKARSPWTAHTYLYQAVAVAVAVAVAAKEIKSNDKLWTARYFQFLIDYRGIKILDQRETCLLLIALKRINEMDNQVVTICNLQKVT